MTVGEIYDGVIKDKDIISDGDLQAPREFFRRIHDIRLVLIRIQNEGDAHSNALATASLKLLDEAFEVGRG